MSYLSPAKIWLVVLLKLLQQGCVPDKALSAVLTFLASHVQPEVAASLAATNKSVTAAPDLFIPKPDTFKTSLHGFASAYESTKGAPLSCTLWQLFAKQIKDIRSLDDLTALLSDVEHFFSNESGSQEDATITVLAPTSPFGVFVRRVKVEFELLRFADMMQLWHDFKAYGRPLVNNADLDHLEACLALELPLEDSEQHSDETLDDDYGWASEIISHAVTSRGDADAGLSQFDFERLLGFQVAQMQSQHPSCHACLASLLTFLQDMEAHFPSKCRSSSKF